MDPHYQLEQELQTQLSLHQYALEHQRWAQPLGGSSMPRLFVSACCATDMSQIISGEYDAFETNHGRPVYKRETGFPGSIVVIYFWDDRDGADFGGWWFGPRVGSDQIWCHSDVKDTTLPPMTGWKVPWDGSLDPSLQISPAPPAAPSLFFPLPPPPPVLKPLATTSVLASWPSPTQVQAKDFYGQLSGKARPAPYEVRGSVARGKWQPLPRAQPPPHLSWHQGPTPTPVPVPTPGMSQSEDAISMAARELPFRKRFEELRHRREELAAERQERTAVLIVRLAIKRLREATPKEVDGLILDLERVLLDQLVRTGLDAQALQEEAGDAKLYARESVVWHLEAERSAQNRLADDEAEREQETARIGFILRQAEDDLELARTTASQAVDAVAAATNAADALFATDSAHKALDQFSRSLMEKRRAIGDSALAHALLRDDLTMVPLFSALAACRRQVESAREAATPAAGTPAGTEPEPYAEEQQKMEIPAEGDS